MRARSSASLGRAGGPPPPLPPPPVPPNLSLRREDAGQGPPTPMPPPARPLPSATFNYETRRARWAQPKDPQRSRGLQRQALVTPRGPLGHVSHGRDTPLPSHSCRGPEWPWKVTASQSLQDMLPLVPSPTPLGVSISLHLCLPLSPPTLPPIQGVSPILNHMWEPGLDTGRLAELSLAEQPSSP